MKKVKAINNFTWKGQDGNFFVRKGEIIEVDNVAYKQLLKELGLCEDLNSKENAQ